MVHVVFTANLARHLHCPELDLPGSTVSEVLDHYFAAHPQVRRYILDDQNALQRHINVFVEDHPTRDRTKLSEPVKDGQTIFVFQALSGG